MVRPVRAIHRPREAILVASGAAATAHGRLWLNREGVECFAGDLAPEEKSVVWATQVPPAADLFNGNAPGVAWKTKPNWYIVATKDRTVQPDLERFLAKRMNATTTRSNRVTS